MSIAGELAKSLTGTSVHDLPPLALEVVHGFDAVKTASELTRLLRRPESK